MGYQNVKTPRFYIDHLQYIRAIGKGVPASGEDIFRLNPSSFSANKPANAGVNYWDFGALGFTAEEASGIPNVNYGKLNYLAILGHNLADCMEGSLDVSFRDNVDYSSNADFKFSSLNPVEVANYESDSTIHLDGFSIATFDDTDFNGLNLWFEIDNTSTENKISSLSLGRYYNMPHSPDLSLSMSHSYDGIKKIQTKGGSTLSNANFHKPPKWGDREAWQLGDFPYYYSGRRTWDLSFSYISDTDIEPYSYYGNKYDGDTPQEGTDNWFQNVLYYTMGGHLPFIFCPDPSIEYYYDATLTDDSGNILTVPPRTPEFAICRFDMNSFKREQVANNVYNIKVKIVESW